VEIFTASKTGLTVPQVLAVVRQKLGLHTLRTVALDAQVPGVENATWQDIIPDSVSIEQLVEIRETARLLMQHLTEREARVVASFVEGRSMDEIASLIGCSKSTVHNNLYSAVDKIRDSGVTGQSEVVQVMGAVAELITQSS
jgi:RNA polymerase sigma factor (sigma-70 family)